VLLGVLCLSAAGADLFAADLPLACRVTGTTYLLPCLTRPAALKGEDNQTLRARADWLVAPPIPFGPLDQHPGGRTEVGLAPSRVHLLGTDDRGRDVAARLVHGARVTFLVGPLAVCFYLCAGIACGLGCASSRRLDLILGRMIELGLAFPTLFLLLALQSLVARVSLVELAVVIAVAEWPRVALLTRAEAKRQAMAPHVEAARALGVAPLQLMVRHVLPQAITPAITYAAFGVGRAVLFESGLTFLGLGAPVPTASWGELLAQAQASGGRLALLIPAALAITATVLGCNLIGDELTDRLRAR
jgi:ABC-type dipeptide/oligopeptide/nickel transport system permease subunit